MAGNSSSASNSSDLLSFYCDTVSTSIIVSMAAFAVRAILMLPLCSVVLSLSHRQRQQQLPTSHADMFTYHMMAVQVIWFLGGICYVCGKYANLVEVQTAGVYLFFIVFYGESLLHLLTCVERYLAVVHPITYLRLKQARGVRIRNISIGCVWLLSFASMALVPFYPHRLPSLPFLCTLVLSLMVTSFCSLSILWVLIRPGPGEGSMNKERVDQSKLRALRTVTTIMGLLSLWFVWYLVSLLLENFPQVDDSVTCVVMSAVTWFNMPCSLLLPLLYLHRAGKLPCCC